MIDSERYTWLAPEPSYVVCLRKANPLVWIHQSE